MCGPFRKKWNVNFLQFKLCVFKLISGIQVGVSLYRNNDTIEHNSSAVGRVYGREKAP
jgi:hypothetical protein